MQLPLQHTALATCLSTRCTGSGDVGQDLPSSCINIEPVVIELVRDLVTQGLMRVPSLVCAVPGQQPVEGRQWDLTPIATGTVLGGKVIVDRSFPLSTLSSLRVYHLTNFRG